MNTVLFPWYSILYASFTIYCSLYWFQIYPSHQIRMTSISHCDLLRLEIQHYKNSNTKDLEYHIHHRTGSHTLSEIILAYFLQLACLIPSMLLFPFFTAKTRKQIFLKHLSFPFLPSDFFGAILRWCYHDELLFSSTLIIVRGRLFSRWSYTVQIF